MLDVHPPHSKLEGVRDFLLHIFTITIGLLIALGLEGCVERYHKAEIRHEAEANLRQEMRDNKKKMDDWQPVLKEEEKNLKMVLNFIEARKAGKTADISQVNLSYSIRSLDDASWRTATATGALSLMDYNDVQKYAGAYQVQDRVSDLQKEALNEYLQLQARATYIDPLKADAAQLAEAEPLAAVTYAHVATMQTVGKKLGELYKEILKEK